MIINNIETTNGTITQLIVENDDNRITNKSYSFFSKSVYLSKNDSPDNYLEVGYNIWGMYVEGEIPKNEVEVLSSEIDNINSSVSNLEEISLDTDFRLMVLEMKIKEATAEEVSVIASLFRMSSNEKSYIIGNNQLYTLLKKRIERKTYATKEDMQYMLDLYFYNNRTTSEQYEELSELLNSQE